MKLEILFATIERWHCIGLWLKNIKNAEIPEGTQILCVAQAGDEYVAYLKTELKKTFKKVRVIQRKEAGVDHGELRRGKNKCGNWTDAEAQQNKIKQVGLTYKVLRDNIDESMDYYWIMEDDTLFPLNFYPRSLSLMHGLNADAVAGVSYRWRTLPQKTHDDNHNFCNIVTKKVFPNDDASKEYTTSYPRKEYQESGVTKLGMTGLSGILAKAKCVKAWTPRHIEQVNSGADVSFSLTMKENEFNFYGCWDLCLSHFTQYENGDIQILGKIDKSLIDIINK